MHLHSQRYGWSESTCLVILNPFLWNGCFNTSKFSDIRWYTFPDLFLKYIDVRVYSRVFICSWLYLARLFIFLKKILCLHALEKEMATHSNVFAWRIPGTGEPGGLLSVGSHRVGHDWSDSAAAAAAAAEGQEAVDKKVGEVEFGFKASWLKSSDCLSDPQPYSPSEIVVFKSERDG